MARYEWNGEKWVIPGDKTATPMSTVTSLSECPANTYVTGIDSKGNIEGCISLQHEPTAVKEPFPWTHPLDLYLLLMLIAYLIGYAIGKRFGEAP